MTDKQSSYRQIMKATSLFGGVQIIIILIGIVRTKFVAILLGSTGVGIIGLLNAPLGLIGSVTALGLSFSAIRNISEAAGSGDEQRLAKVLITFRRWVRFTGLFGMVVTILLAPWLSKWTFGTNEYAWTFIWLSVVLLLNDISAGQRALLQGMRKLQSMAKATTIGSFVGLLTSIPLYYLYGTKGIPPSLIISAVVSLILSWYFARKVNVVKVIINYKESYHQGMDMVKLGIVLTISGIIGTGIRYIINVYIGRNGGIDQVGLYQAGFVLLSTYLGLIFTAMGTDYFPKLAEINSDNVKCKEIINHQITIAITIVTPLCSLLLTYFPLVIKLFYSEKFLQIVPMGEWLVLSVFLKTIVWAVGYLFYAKGALKTAFVLDNLINVVLIGGYIILYSKIGLEGIGIADLLMYIIALPLFYFTAKKNYEFSFNKDTMKIISLFAILLLINFMAVKIFEKQNAYIVGTVITLTIIILSLIRLNKQIGLIDYIREKFK
jgi:O-antigen/teichoic acid export membrane protein